MKYITSIILTAFIIANIPFSASAYSAKSMVLLEKSTGSVLLENNSDAVLPMASTTKIMTALVVLESISLDIKVKIPDDAVGVEGSSMYLVKGETLTVEELLYGLMLTSGNDAATALAIAVGGDEQSFVSMMNDKASALGLVNTHFKNPSGLPDDEHYTTAYELALITSFALSNPTFAKIVSTRKIKISYNGNPEGRTLSNHNKLLHLYDDAIGVKTGFTKKAGRCLVGAATRDGVTLICVTLNDGDDWADHVTAFNYGFKQTKNITICEKDSIQVKLLTPDGKSVFAKNSNTLTAIMIGDTQITQKIIAEKFVYAPKTLGQIVGEVVFYADDLEVGRDTLYLTQSLNSPPIKKQSVMIKIIKMIKGFFKWQN